MGQENPALEGLPEPGEPVFYPKVGHCIYRGVTEDRVAPGTELLELEDLEEGSRILIPLGRVPQLNLRPAGTAFQEIQDVLGAEFEEPLEDEDERHKLVEELITEGSARALAQSLKRLHLLRQTVGLSREEEQTRKKIRSWLAAEVSISRECTRAEAQAFMTRILQESMAKHQRKEKAEAKERRRAAREQKKAEETEAADSQATAAPEPTVEDAFGSSSESAEPAPATEEAAGPEASEQSGESATPEQTDEPVPEASANPEQKAGALDIVEPDEVAPRAQTEVAPDATHRPPRAAEEESPLG